MKKLVFLVAIIFTAANTFAQTWTWDVEPEAGQMAVIQINDVPEDGPMHVVYYCFNGSELITNDAGVIPSDVPAQINVALAIPMQTSWVRVVVKNEFNQIGSGDDRMVKNAKALPKAGLVEYSMAASIYGRMMAMTVDNQQVLANFREATKAYPLWLENGEVFRSYYTIAKRENSTQDLDVLKTQLNDLANKTNNANEAMLVQAVRAAKDMGDSTLQVTLRKKLDKKFPKSILPQEEMLAAFSKTTTVAEKIKMRDQFKSMYPITKDNKRFVDQMTGMIAQQYAEAEDWTQVANYVGQMLDPMARASASNNYAWTLSGESIDAEAPNLIIADNLSAASLALIAQDNPPPTGLTKKEWTKMMDNYKGMYGDTYALILYKQDKYEEAITYQSFAVANNDFENGEMNERYAVYLEKAEHYKDLEKFMDQIIVSGKATAHVKDMHKNYWTQTASPDQLYAQYVKKLDDEAKALMEDKVRKMWEDRDAASFTLTDLSGNQVSLADYKGKTIVLDFWATWCGPCKASFPGMKNAVEHFSSDQSVVFLFVDTWESGDNIQGKVADFIDSNNYPFHVLMDLEHKVVKDFGVSGIPTKFVIGPDQKIRFTAVGYSGNNEELVEELKTMIEMVKENSKMVKS